MEMAQVHSELGSESRLVAVKQLAAPDASPPRTGQRRFPRPARRCEAYRERKGFVLGVVGIGLVIASGLSSRAGSGRHGTGAGFTASLRCPRNGGSVAASALGADEESAVLGQTGTQFPTRADTELGEHLAEMPLHRARAEEELRADLRVRQAISS
jgi:hypothetical protein